MSYFTGISGITQTTGLQQQIYSENSALTTKIVDPLGIFGGVETVSTQPQVNVDFVYGINNQVMSSSVLGLGTITSGNSLAILSTTAAASSSAILSSLRSAIYYPGQGVVGRFTASFTVGAANSEQYAGLFTPTFTNGFGFGYSGTGFGIWYITNSISNFINQSAWNVDTCDGSGGVNNPSGLNLNKQNGNVYQIKYQYLGFGNIEFYLENPESSRFILVHIIKYSNSSPLINIGNPNLAMCWRALNSTNTSNIVVRAGSGAIFTEGQESFLRGQFSFDNNKSGITTLTNIFTIRNCSTYNLIPNFSNIRIRHISLASAGGGSQVANVVCFLNPTVGGTPAFTPTSGSTADNGVSITSGNAVSSVDTAGTTVTGGTQIFNISCNITGQQILDVTGYNIIVRPGDRLCFSGKATGATIISVSVVWNEQV